MFRKRRLSEFFSVLVILLVIGTSNCCVLEDLFSSLSQSILEIERPHHLPSHLEVTSKHTREDPPEPLEHCQPHPLIILKPERSGSAGINLVAPLTPVVIIGFLLFNTEQLEQATKIKKSFTASDQWDLLTDLTINLVSASRAPPVAA